MLAQHIAKTEIEFYMCKQMGIETRLMTVDDFITPKNSGNWQVSLTGPPINRVCCSFVCTCKIQFLFSQCVVPAYMYTNILTDQITFSLVKFESKRYRKEYKS